MDRLKYFKAEYNTQCCRGENDVTALRRWAVRPFGRWAVRPRYVDHYYKTKYEISGEDAS